MATALFLSEAEQQRLQAFPTELTRDDIAAYFTLSRRDLDATRRLRGQQNRLGLGVLLGALRLLGFVPAALDSAPTDVRDFVAAQLRVAPDLKGYPQRSKTRTAHVNRAVRHLGLRRASRGELAEVQGLLVSEAAAHARPTALLRWLIENLRERGILRPGLSSLAQAAW